MWPVMFVTLSPHLNFIMGINERQEPILIQKLSSEFNIERLYKRVIRWLARSAKVEFNLVKVSLLSRCF